MKFYEIKNIYLDFSDEYNYDGTHKEHPNDYSRAFENYIWDSYFNYMTDEAIQRYFSASQCGILKCKLVEAFVIKVKIKQEIDL